MPATPVNYVVEGGTDHIDDITVQVNGTPLLRTATTVAGSPIVTVVTTSIAPGMSVIGAGMLPGNFIRTNGSGVVTLDQPATVSGTNVLSFGDFVGANLVGVTFLFSAKLLLPKNSIPLYGGDTGSNEIEFDWTQTNIIVNGLPIGMTFLQINNNLTNAMLSASLALAPNATYANNPFNWSYEVRMVCPTNLVSSIQTGVIAITQPVSGRII